MLLQDKIAVVYGGGGKIGAAVARAFVHEGATVFLAGRTPEKLEIVAEEIRQMGWTAETAVVDALNPQDVKDHLAVIIERFGHVDISFNAISIRGDLQGTPLVEMNWEDFTTPVMVGTKTHFITATAAARIMAEQNSGAILTLSSSASVLSGRDRRFHRTGGFSTACAAIEAFTRSLAGEVGMQGVRVVCLRPDAIPETWSPEHQDDSDPNSTYA
ncbi:MAG: SDR family oxidoreductase, partial [Anaerolineae bacterium]|nr:SDR family oxidoreductase [Anaerolineae bacterium]